jgi:ABC-type sugar transport system substrate-binding protein
MLRSRTVGLLAVVVGGLLFSVSALSAGASMKASQPVKIAFLVPELADPYWAAGEKGAKAEAAKDNVNLTVTGTNTFTPSAYNAALQDEIAAGANGLLIAPGDPKASNSLIDQAVAKKIGVATVVVDVTGSKRNFFIGPNATDIGKNQAERVLAYLHAKGAKGVVETAIMSCSPTALSQMLEHQAETQVFNSNPYKSQFTIKVDTFLNSTADPTTNLAAYNSLSTAYPNLKVVIGQCGLDPISAGEVNQRRHLNWIVAGDSFVPQSLKLVQEGYVTWSMNEEPYETLEAAVQMLASGIRNPSTMPTGVKSIPLQVAVSNPAYFKSINFPGPVISVAQALKSPDAVG